METQEKIRRYLERTGKTLQAFARESGTDPSTLHKIYSGKRREIRLTTYNRLKPFFESIGLD